MVTYRDKPVGTEFNGIANAAQASKLKASKARTNDLWCNVYLHLIDYTLLNEDRCRI